MSYSIQAEMKKRVDDLGTTLLEKIIPYQSKERNKHFRTRRPITHTIDQQQMSGPMIGGDVDASGRTYDRHYLEGDLAYSLPDEDSDDLYRASDQLLKIRWVREGFARSSIEDEVFKWSCITHRAETRQSLSEYIIDLALKNIKKTTVYVPINFLEAEEDFTFGELRFKTLTAEFLSELFVKMEAITPGKHTDSLKAMHSEMCSKTQGLVAVVVELEAESEFAHKRAHAIASVAVSLFRFFSGASVSPWLTCPCSALGSELVSEYYVFSYDGISAFQLTHGLLPGFNGSWQLTKQELDMISKGCFTEMGELIQDAGLTEFQRRLRSSLLTYTKGLSIPSIGDRLVFTFSSVEMLFLRDASEPIQQNVGERMAFLTEHSAEKRRSVVESVKKAYQLRSRYVHHGLDVEDRGELESFQRSAFYAFFNALKATKKFEKHSDFLSRLDQIKYGS